MAGQGPPRRNDGRPSQKKPKGRPKRPASGSTRGGRERPSPHKAEEVPGVRNPYVRFRKLERPPLEPALTTLWEYPSQHYGKGEQGSSSYRGATPSWVIWQVIQRFTRTGARVLDPFCGSGTTLDVCRDTKRDGVGFDVSPYRADIQKADARQLPLADASIDLAFLDPPYADNLTYSDAPDCIGKTRAQDGSYFAAMDDVFREMERVLRPGGHLAIYVQDILQSRGGGKAPRFWPLGIELSHLAAARFSMVDHVSVVRRNKDLQKGSYRKAASEQGFWLRGFNHLLIFEKSVEPAGGRARKTTSSSSKTRRSASPAKKKTRRQH